MDLVYKIVAVALVGCIATIIVKPVRSDYAVLIALASGVIILAMLVNYLSSVFDALKLIINTTGISGNLYSLLIKIVGRGYLIEFTAGICADTGNSSLGDKVLLGGKIIILVMAMPIVTSILQIIMELLP